MMKGMKLKYFLVLVALLSILPWKSELKAQPYMHAAGIRAGYSSGITYKGFRLHEMWAIEADLLYNRHGFNVSALYEQHLEPFHNKRTFIYLGGGAFGGNWNQEFSMGLAAVAGIEYTLRDLPLNFSLDWKPMLNVYAVFEPDFLDIGISARYRFGR